MLAPAGLNMSSFSQALVFDNNRRIALRQINILAGKSRPNDDELDRLDASLKKNTAYVKRLKNITAENYMALASDFAGLKLTKYMAEAVTAISENRLRTANDIYAAVEISSLLHQRYAGFAPSLLAVISPMFTIEKKIADDKPIVQQRAFIRFLAELYIVGVLSSDSPIQSALKKMLVEDDVIGPRYIPLATSFVRNYAAEYLGMGAAVKKSDSESIVLFVGTVSQASQEIYRSLFADYFRAMCRLLVRTHHKLQSLKKGHRQVYESRGDLNEANTAVLREALENFDKMRNGLNGLADVLQEQLPMLQEDETIQRTTEGKIIFVEPSMLHKAGQTGALTIYDSEEDRLFYEDIPDLRQTIPESLLDSSQTATTNTVESPLPVEDELAALDSAGLCEVDPEAPTKITYKDTGMIPSKDEASLKAFLDKLSTLHSRDEIDQAANAFCFLNSRVARRRLAETLVEATRHHIDLIPYFGRLMAILQPCFKDIGDAVVTSLKGQFLFLLHRKEPILGSRSRVCRYIGELTKFRIMPQGVAFICIKRCIDDLTNYNVDMACMLLESCGLFLLYQPESHNRLVKLIDVLKRKKTSLLFDSNQLAMITNAIYVCNPPEQIQTVRMPKSPMQLFIHKLIRAELCAENAKSILRLLRSMPWQDKTVWQMLLRHRLTNMQVVKYMHQTILKPWKIKFANIPLLAAIVSGLQKTHEAFAIRVVDDTLEQIRIYLENPWEKRPQKQIAMIRLLGELYNYRLCEAEVIFETLNTLVTYGHGKRDVFGTNVDITIVDGIPRVTKPSELDSPREFFRIRLCCTLLTTCGKYFNEGDLVTALDNFLVLLQYYICTKDKLPIELEFVIQDTFDELYRQFDLKALDLAISQLVNISTSKLAPLLEDSNHMIQGGSVIDEPEDTSYAEPTDQVDDLDKALANIIIQSTEERKLEKRPGLFDAAMPIGIMPARSSLDSGVAESGFTLLTKKRNKMKATELQIPVEDAEKPVLESASPPKPYPEPEHPNLSSSKRSHGRSRIVHHFSLTPSKR